LAIDCSDDHRVVESGLMRTLLVDATSLSKNPKGVGKYAYEVLVRLDHLLPQSWRIILVISREPMPELNCTQRLTKIVVAPKSSLRLGLKTIPALIRHTRADLLLRLCDDVGRRYSVPTLTVCHDINELIARVQKGEYHFFRGMINGVKEFFRVWALRASTMVVCNSEFTRQQCVSRYGVEKKKTTIGYCGVANDFYRVNRDEAVWRTKSAFGCEHYVLCFATGDPRENYAIISDIITATKRIGLSAKYVIAGIQEGQSYVWDLKRSLLDHAPDEDYFLVPFLGSGEMQELCDLYAAADYYLELSLHEGFGMQLAEAMACGTQCLAPTHSALTEVGSSFVLHIDPTDVSNIADTIVSGYEQQLHKQNHVDQITYTRRFSWDKTASVIAKSLIELEVEIL